MAEISGAVGNHCSNTTVDTIFGIVLLYIVGEGVSRQLCFVCGSEFNKMWELCENFGGILQKRCYHIIIK